MEPKLSAILERVSRDGRVVVLTGAGISAESGIPTFRGPEGYWTVGSKEYHPQEMATWAMFTRRPTVVWPWYLYRRAICRAADPNAAHRAVVALERQLGDILGLKVEVSNKGQGGSVTLHYSSLDQLDMICQRLSGEPI